MCCAGTTYRNPSSYMNQYKLCSRINSTLVSFSVRISRGLRVWRRGATRWKVGVIPRSTHLGSSKKSVWAWYASQSRNARRKNQTHILIFLLQPIFHKTIQNTVFSIGNPIQILLKMQWFVHFLQRFMIFRKSKYAFDFFALRCAIDSHITLRPTFLTSPSALNAESPLLSNALPLVSKLANLVRYEPKI